MPVSPGLKFDEYLRPTPVIYDQPTGRIMSFDASTNQWFSLTDMPVPVSSSTARICYDTDGNGQNILDHTGNPMGAKRTSQYRGRVRYVLSSNDVVFGDLSNDIVQATANKAAIQAILDAFPVSGGVLEIPHDLCTYGEITFPRRTVTDGVNTYTNVPINCEICGSHSGATIVNLANTVALSSDVGVTQAGVLYPSDSSRQILRDINIVSYGTGVRVTGNGKGFYADNVFVRTRGSYGWWFDQCFGMGLGYIGANQNLGDGFYFTDCIGVHFNHLQARGNRGVGIKCRGPIYRCTGFNGGFDSEGNVGYNLDLDMCQQWSVAGYDGDGTYRTKVTNSSRMTIKGNYVIGSTDRYSRCLNPDIIPRGETAYTNTVAPYKSSLATATLTNTGTSRFRLQCPSGESGFVRIWDSLDGGSDSSGTVVSSVYAVRVRFVVRNSSATVGTPGVLSWKSNGSTPTDLAYDIPGDGVFEMEGFPTHDTINYISFTPNVAGTTDIDIEIVSVTQLGYAP